VNDIPNQSAEVENELVRNRPAPRDDFVAGLARSIGSRRQRARAGRLGLATAMAGLVLIALGATGGAGYAYSGATSAVNHVASAIHLNQSNPVSRPNSSSGAQYGPVPVPPCPSKNPNCSKGGGGTGGGGSGGGGNGGGGNGGGGGSSSGGGGTAGQSGGSNGQPGTTGNVSGTTQNNGTGLPFTGLSLIVPVLLGAALIGFGIVLRRRGRATTN
jgi:hypothetical protein